MSSIPSLDLRVASLESALRRTRSLAFSLASAWLWLAVAGFARQPQEQVVTQRLVLTNAADSAVVVLVAGPESSLVVQTPAGAELIRLGGPSVRRVGHGTASLHPCYSTRKSIAWLTQTGTGSPSRSAPENR